jgi:L-threonylcarbamoyladenylate synthase
MSSAIAAGVSTWRFGEDPAIVAAALERGAVVAIPTESSYGLAVDPLDRAAVARVFRWKGRRATEALPVVGASAAAFLGLGVEPQDPALRWAAGFWPAPLTVLVPVARPIAASAGRRTIALRVPAHEQLRGLLAALGRPLTATSANPSGAAPYLEAGEVTLWLRGLAGPGTNGDEALVVDGGRLPGGPPSTLVELVAGRPRILRPGRFPVD